MFRNKLAIDVVSNFQNSAGSLEAFSNSVMFDIFVFLGLHLISQLFKLSCFLLASFLKLCHVILHSLSTYFLFVTLVRGGRFFL